MSQNSCVSLVVIYNFTSDAGIQECQGYVYLEYYTSQYVTCIMFSFLEKESHYEEEF